MKSLITMVTIVILICSVMVLSMPGEATRKKSKGHGTPGGNANGQGLKPPQWIYSADGKGLKPPQWIYSADGQGMKPPQWIYSADGQGYKPPQWGPLSAVKVFQI